MLNIDERARMGARNNADFYAAMFSSWGLRFERRDYAFVAEDAPPPYYSHLTVLSEGRRSEVIDHMRHAAERFPGTVGFKDSFCEFDLSDQGFRVLFEASWIWRPAQSNPAPSGWSQVSSVEELRTWELAWKLSSPTTARMFRDSMIDNADVRFLGKFENGEIVAGAIANVSRDCVGLSNVFSNRGEDAFSEATAAVAGLHPVLPIVGYQRGEGLSQAMRAGFEVTGSLRILNAEHARF